MATWRWCRSERSHAGRHLSVRHPGDDRQRCFVRREWFDPTKLPVARAVTVKARDGLMLHGYLTPPRGVIGAGPVPMVVMPHGGPFGIFDTLSFDDDTPVDRAGYAVLRILPRFRQLWRAQWGGRMQDDLTDATRWAIGQNIADPLASASTAPATAVTPR
jgi:dipeptidyl aminopeptidase/acylaminoacyl peptidase